MRQIWLPNNMETARTLKSQSLGKVQSLEVSPCLTESRVNQLVPCTKITIGHTKRLAFFH